ncbi:MAG: S9 family peptidase [Bacteroidetes bacterium]|nr:S9 family peptidase [Bacteroidota bacterium]
MIKLKMPLVVVMLYFVCTSSIAQKDFTLQEIFGKFAFRAESITGIKSMNNGITYTALDNDTINQTSDIALYEYATGKKIKTIFEGKILVDGAGKVLAFDEYSFSSNEKRILFTCKMEAIYRHSFKADYYVYDLVEKKMYNITNGVKAQLADFSPDGNDLAYVRDNNLYVQRIGSNTEKMISHDGKPNHIINGAPDWVYEEEFSFSKAFEWAPDGKHIAWYRFDESRVREFSLTMFDSLYPTEVKYKYPKAGEENSKVEIHIFSFETNQKAKAQINAANDQYIPRIKWTADANTLCITRMNRLQNNLELLLCDANSGAVSTLYTETSSTYIDINDALEFTADKKNFIWMGVKNGYNALMWMDMKGKLVKQITTDKKNVINYYGYDAAKKMFYYSSFNITPADRQVYSIDLNGKKNIIGHADGINTPTFSKGFKYAIMTHNTANSVPLVELYETSGKKIKVLEENTALAKKLGDYKISKKEFMTITTKDGIELQAWMIKPQNFDANKKYPVLMYVYGGPGAPTVLNAGRNANDYWYQHLASLGYIVVSVDNRGTTPKDDAFLKCTYKQLGKLEAEDQIAAAKYFATLPFVDGNRIGIWGWSFGGYMTSLCMCKGSDIFKVGIAVAPVTNWRYYDSIYTERYLQTPQENKSGYDDNSPINFVANMKGKYMLVHGVADDNVHYQNAMMMVNELVKNNVPYTMLDYPNANHGIRTKGARLHLYTAMTKFILENL